MRSPRPPKQSRQWKVPFILDLRVLMFWMGPTAVPILRSSIRTSEDVLRGGNSFSNGKAPEQCQCPEYTGKFFCITAARTNSEDEYSAQELEHVTCHSDCWSRTLARCAESLQQYECVHLIVEVYVTVPAVLLAHSDELSNSQSTYSPFYSYPV